MSVKIETFVPIHNPTCVMLRLWIKPLLSRLPVERCSSRKKRGVTQPYLAAASHTSARCCQWRRVVAASRLPADNAAMEWLFPAFPPVHMAERPSNSATLPCSRRP